ncbi:hypothetical protein [Pseudomonas phage ZQG1]|nr:hypothetical protein [Pseudomonas phage ZQG1]
MKAIILLGAFLLSTQVVADTQAQIEEEILQDLKRAAMFQEDPNPGRRAFVASQTGGQSMEMLSATVAAASYQVPRGNIEAQALGVAGALSMSRLTPMEQVWQQMEYEKAWDKALDPIMDMIWSQYPPQ